jgi:activator of Hsp90 ATPase-like protein
MTSTERASSPPAARVSAEYSQFWVAGGADIGPSAELIPGLLLGLGPQGVAVLTGREAGPVTVTARAVPAPPGDVDADWDVVAETDIDSPDGTISVLDWAGPDHPELGELAAAGPGRYRLRVHARHREKTRARTQAEQYHLLAWPTARPEPPRLLTTMDSHGRLLNGEPEPGEPPLDALELAAAKAVRRIASLTARPGPPELSGELTSVRVLATAPAAPRWVWTQISNPWTWFGTGGGTDPGDFQIYLHDEPRVDVRGHFLVSEAPTHLAMTWFWTSVPDEDARTPWTLPPRPTTVDILLRRQEADATEVQIEHRDLPVELADLVRPFWEWALQELHRRLTRAPFYGYPWDR